MLHLARGKHHANDHITASPAELAQGILIIGQHGMGKTQLVRSLLAQEVEAGRTVGLLDATGDYLPELAGYVPHRAINETAYIDFADIDHPVAFNPVATVPPTEHVAVKDAVLTALKALFGDSWGPRMEYILAFALAATIEHRGGTMLTLQELLVNADVRRRVLQDVSDPFVQAFFRNEFDQWDERFRREAIAPIQNKVGQFLLDPAVRNVVCQTKNAVPSLGTAPYLLARAPRHGIGETASRLLSLALLARWLQTDGQASVYVPDLHRLDAPDLAGLVERAAESNLRLVVSVPSLATVSESLRQRLLASMGHLIAFRLGADDAELLQKQLDRFNPDRAFQEVASLDPGALILRRRQQAVAQQYTTATVPDLPRGWQLDVMEKVIEQSRDRYATPRADVEAKLTRHVERTMGEAST